MNRFRRLNMDRTFIYENNNTVTDKSIKDLINRGFSKAEFGKSGDYRILNEVFRRLQVAIQAKIDVGLSHESIIDWLVRVIQKSQMHTDHARRFTLTGDDVTNGISVIDRIDHVYTRVTIIEDDNSNDDNDSDDSSFNCDDDNSDSDDSDDDNSNTGDDDDDDDDGDDGDKVRESDTSSSVTDDQNANDLVVTTSEISTKETSCNVVVTNCEVSTVKTSGGIDVEIYNLKTEISLKDEKIQALKDLVELEDLQSQARMKDEEIKELEELLAKKRGTDVSSVKKRKTTISDSRGTSSVSDYHDGDDGDGGDNHCTSVKKRNIVVSFGDIVYSGPDYLLSKFY